MDVFSWREARPVSRAQNHCHSPAGTIQVRAALHCARDMFERRCIDIHVKLQEAIC